MLHPAWEARCTDWPSWRPIAGDAARDLGYTVGAYTAGGAKGNYVTVWRLEPDGSWRHVLDGGVSG